MPGIRCRQGSSLSGAQQWRVVWKVQASSISSHGRHACYCSTLLCDALTWRLDGTSCVCPMRIAALSPHPAVATKNIVVRRLRHRAQAPAHNVAARGESTRPLAKNPHNTLQRRLAVPAPRVLHVSCQNIPPGLSACIPHAWIRLAAYLGCSPQASLPCRCLCSCFRLDLNVVVHACAFPLTVWSSWTQQLFTTVPTCLCRSAQRGCMRAAAAWLPAPAPLP